MIFPIWLCVGFAMSMVVTVALVVAQLDHRATRELNLIHRRITDVHDKLEQLTTSGHGERG